MLTRLQRLPRQDFFFCELVRLPVAKCGTWQCLDVWNHAEHHPVLYLSGVATLVNMCW